MPTSTDYRIIDFQPARLAVVKALITQVLVDLEVIPPGPIIEDEDLDRIGEIYGGRGGFWLALAGETLIGTVALRDMGGGVAKLKRMFVATEHHGRGVGQALLDHALARAGQQGFTEVILGTHKLMHRAHRFYERNGFHRYELTDFGYRYRLELDHHR